MKITVKHLFVVFAIITISYAIFTSNRRKMESRKIVLKEDCEVVKANDSVSFNFEPFKKSYKAVCLLEDQTMSELKRWIPYINRYKNFPFLFYIKTDEKELVVENLKELNFPLPVFIELISGERKEHRITLIGYIIDENNNIIKVTNPSMPGYNSLLKKYSRKNSKFN